MVEGCRLQEEREDCGWCPSFIPSIPVLEHEMRSRLAGLECVARKARSGICAPRIDALSAHSHTGRLRKSLSELRPSAIAQIFEAELLSKWVKLSTGLAHNTSSQARKIVTPQPFLSEGSRSSVWSQSMSLGRR